VLRFLDVGAPGGRVAYALMVSYIGMQAGFAVR